MKVIILSLFLTGLALGNLVSLGSGCPDQQVANSQGICIRPSYIEGCDVYKNVEECDTCKNGYENDAHNAGKCALALESAKVPEKFNGCLEEDGQACTKCANGFRNIAGVCKVGTLNCDSYDDAGKCKKCSNEYSLIFGECKHNSLLGCKVEDENHSCKQCYKPFVLENNHCYIPNCKALNDYGCVSCECGFFITEDRRCQKLPCGCLKATRGVCVECLPHYKLTGGVCSIEGCLSLAENLCTACKTDYDLVDGTCRFKNCFDWKDDTCHICNEGYNLVGGRCVENKGKYVCNG